MCTRQCKQAASLQQALPAKEGSPNTPGPDPAFYISWLTLPLVLYLLLGNFHCIKSCCCFCCTPLDEHCCGWTPTLLPRQPSWQVRVTRRGVAVCDTEGKEMEYNRKVGEEIYALAKNTINKSCHRQRSLVLILPRLFFQTFPLFCTALSTHPCRCSITNILTLAHLQSHFCRDVQEILSIKDTLIMTVPTLGIVPVITIPSI